MLDKEKINEEKVVKVGVIGESGVGKSTLIAGLTKKEYREALCEKTKENKGGQTKIGIHYRLCDPQSVGSYDIDWNYEGLTDYFVKKDSSGKTIGLLEKIGITKCVETILDQKDIDDETLRDAIKTRIREYLKDDEYKKGIDDLYDDIVNNPEWIIDSNTRLINSISVEIPADEAVWQMIHDAGFESIELWDTRGFLDGLKSDIKNQEEIGEEKYVDYMVTERGLKGVDACIYFDTGAINRPTLEVQKTYYPLIKSLLCANPFIVVSRSLNIRKSASSEEKFDYKEAKKDLIKDKTSDIHNSIISTVIDEIIDDEKDLKTMLKLNNMRAVIASRMKDDETQMNDDEDEIWLATCAGVLNDLLEAVKRDRKYINKWIDTYNSIVSNVDQLIDTFKSLYEIGGKFCIDKAIKYKYRGSEYSYESEKLYMKLIAPLYGEYAYDSKSFLGPRGGYYPNNPIEERYAINILESAYSERYKKVLPKLIDANKGMIEEEMRIWGVEYEQAKAELDRCMQKESQTDKSWFYRTGLLINTRYFVEAFRRVREIRGISKDVNGYLSDDYRNWFNGLTGEEQQEEKENTVERFFAYLVFYDMMNELDRVGSLTTA